MQQQILVLMFAGWVLVVNILQVKASPSQRANNTNDTKGALQNDLKTVVAAHPEDLSKLSESPQARQENQTVSVISDSHEGLVDNITNGSKIEGGADQGKLDSSTETFHLSESVKNFNMSNVTLGGEDSYGAGNYVTVGIKLNVSTEANQNNPITIPSVEHSDLLKEETNGSVNTRIKDNENLIPDKPFKSSGSSLLSSPGAAPLPDVTPLSKGVPSQEKITLPQVPPSSLGALPGGQKPARTPEKLNSTKTSIVSNVTDVISSSTERVYIQKPEDNLPYPGEDDVAVTDSQSSEVKSNLDSPNEEEYMTDVGSEEDSPKVNNGGNFSDDKDSHFFAYFLTIMVTAIIFYLVFHNKQRIIALIIEGRAPSNGRSRRPSNRARYHKLDNNLEEAITATKGSKYDRIY